MQDLTDDEYKQVLSEAMMDQLKAILEYVKALPTREEFQRVEVKVDRLTDDMQVVKAAIKDTSRQQHDMQHQLDDHERRLQPLEDAA